MKAILQGQLTDISGKQDALTFDEVPIEKSDNPVKSGGVWSELQRKSNPNLLDNWYFVNPVNQRGQTSYGTTGYAIDRWAQTDGNGFTITADGLSSGSMSFYQLIDKDLHGMELTLSVLTTGGLYKGTVTAEAQTPETDVSVTAYEGENITLSFTSMASGLFRFYIVSQAVDVYIAAKLELGPVQTLAHKEGDTWVLNEIPDYGQELAKCQRYQVVLNSSGQNNATVGIGVGHSSAVPDAVILVPVPVEMRANPTLTYSGKWCICATGVIAQNISATNIAVYPINGTRSLFYLGVTTENVVPGQAYIFRANNDKTARIILDANL